MGGTDGSNGFQLPMRHLSIFTVYTFWLENIWFFEFDSAAKEGDGALIREPGQLVCQLLLLNSIFLGTFFPRGLGLIAALIASNLFNVALSTFYVHFIVRRHQLR
jgi:hypothetical protein